MMKMKYAGEGSFTLKYKGSNVPIKNGTEIELDEATAAEFSKRKIGGENQWEKVGSETPKRKKKGEE